MSAPPQARIETEGFRFAHPDTFEVSVQGIEQVVQLLGNDGRGHGEHRRLELAYPARSEIRERRRRRIAPPIRGKLRQRQP
jgi:hypothetical protein